MASLKLSIFSFLFFISPVSTVLATQGTAWASAWALGTGVVLNLFLSNWHPFRKESH